MASKGSRILALIGGVAACACGSSPGSVTGGGTIDGVSFQALSGVAIRPAEVGNVCATSADGGVKCAPTGQEVLTITLSNRASYTCGDIAGASFASFGSIVIGITQASSIGAGSFPIATSDNGAQATFTTTTETCEVGTSSVASGGMITLTGVTSTTVSGTYSLTFASSTLSGSFDVAACPSGDGGASIDGGGVLEAHPITCQQ
jgi:hypothetical protein